MKLKKIIISTICYIVLSSFQSVVCGQTISGKIVDNEQDILNGLHMASDLIRAVTPLSKVCKTISMERNGSSKETLKVSLIT